MWISIIKMRRSWDRLILMMGIVWDSHYKDKTVVRPSRLYTCNRNPYTGKMTSLFWDDPLAPCTSTTLFNKEGLYHHNSDVIQELGRLKSTANPESAVRFEFHISGKIVHSAIPGSIFVKIMQTCFILCILEIDHNSYTKLVLSSENICVS